MDHAGQPAALPLRPLTVGELLDAAVSLLRGHGRVLLPLAAALAVTEQLILTPVRRAAGVQPPAYLPGIDNFGSYWLLLGLGFGLEAAIIAVLGGLAARAAGAAVLGDPMPSRRLLDPRGARFGPVLLVAVVAGLVTLVAALGGPLWVFGYGLVGLAAPAVVLDRVGPGRALARAAGLACRAGLRAGSIRVLGYLAWLAIRVALGLGGVAALDALGLTAQWPTWLGALAWLVVNTIAYPTLACLDAVLHLETRIRTEGLDILLTRAGKHGRLTPALLAVDP